MSTRNGNICKSPIRRLTDMISCRQVLNIMVITGFMFNYMLRVNITIALVDMVYKPNNTATNITIDTTNKFQWDKYATGHVIGSFFWGYILTELPGGRLSEIIGARKVFGFGMVFASIITILTPLACHAGYALVSVLRALIGFCLGATFPSTPPLAARWIPPLERSKFMSNMLASALGAAITMPVCGFLIENIGWESVFYITGVIGLLWSVAWFIFVYDSPAQHPRISAKERQEIESKINETLANTVKPKKVPWRQLLTSMPVWAIVCAHTCSVYGYFTLVNQMPTFMNDVYAVSIKKNGFFSSFPYLGKYVMAVLSSWLADYLRKLNKYKTSTIRNIFTLIAILIPAILMGVQAIWHINVNFSVAIFTLALFFNGGVVGGYFSNGLDIAPNFSGTIMGIANTFSSLGGWVSAALVAVITKDNHAIEQWSYIFWMLVFVYSFGAVFYVIFSSGTTQQWNSVTQTSNLKITEMQPLNKNNEFAA
ncbi:hypothetical protein FQA39_LY01400 [Lamprigera yunnana]|nr:hypothetical protein FQA39_LY01400 [Lamprigera yunnana]